MIQKILTGIFKLMTNLIGILLAPIDTAISSALPSVSSALTSIGSFIDWGIGGVRWAVSYTGLSSGTLALVVAVLTFNLTLPLIVSTIKLAVKWYHNLVP